MHQSHLLVDYYDPMMCDWRKQIDARDTAILELWHLADSFNQMIAATSPSDEYAAALENTILKKYQGFIQEMKKNAAE